MFVYNGPGASRCLASFSLGVGHSVGLNFYEAAFAFQSSLWLGRLLELTQDLRVILGASTGRRNGL